jgi:hypothetical protein
VAAVERNLKKVEGVRPSPSIQKRPINGRSSIEYVELGMTSL